MIIYEVGFVISKNGCKNEDTFVFIHLRKSLKYIFESYCYNFCVKNIKVYLRHLNDVFYASERVCKEF